MKITIRARTTRLLSWRSRLEEPSIIIELRYAVLILKLRNASKNAVNASRAEHQTEHLVPHHRSRLIISSHM